MITAIDEHGKEGPRWFLIAAHVFDLCEKCTRSSWVASSVAYSWRRQSYLMAKAICGRWLTKLAPRYPTGKKVMYTKRKNTATSPAVGCLFSCDTVAARPTIAMLIPVPEMMNSGRRPYRSTMMSGMRQTTIFQLSRDALRTAASRVAKWSDSSKIVLA